MNDNGDGDDDNNSDMTMMVAVMVMMIMEITSVNDGYDDDNHINNKQDCSEIIKYF